jgi:cytochrome P450
VTDLTHGRATICDDPVTVNRASLPPGPRLAGPLQLIGFWTRPTASLERARQRYGNRFTVRLPFQPPFVMLADSDEIRELFMLAPEVAHPGEGARILGPTLGPNSVILLDEAAHLEQRKLLLPAFHGDKMRALQGVMIELAEREVESWPRGEPVALHPRLQRLTLEIILRTVFGLEEGSRLDRLRDLLTEVLHFGESPLSVLPRTRGLALLPPLRRLDAVLARTDELIYGLIEDRRANGSGGDDVLAMLLTARHESPDESGAARSGGAGCRAGGTPDGSPMSARELRDELMTALVAGHETTASQLAWAFERLARAPEVGARLADDLDGGGEEYLTATINEILRHKPVLPNAEPRLLMQPTRIGNFDYPAGVALLACAYLVHHDPEVYPEPYAFRPERFLGVSPGTYTWLPFGGGRRRCIGASFAVQEMKIVLRAVIGRYELSAPSAKSERTGRRSITFSPAGGATVTLRPRVRAGRRELATAA